MNPPNSSTFSSEPGEIRRAFKLFVWVALGLILIDLAANLVFAYPSDPKNMAPGRVAMYFEYGRSTEGRSIKWKSTCCDSRPMPNIRRGCLPAGLFGILVARTVFSFAKRVSRGRCKAGRPKPRWRRLVKPWLN